MNPRDRAEILDRLAAGQISVSEAMALLDPKPGEEKQPEPEPIEALKSEARASTSELPEVMAISIPDEPQGGYKAEPANGAASDKPRWLKIRVRDTATNRSKVTVSLPLGMVRFGLGLARRFGADMGEMDPDELLTMFKSGERGVLVDVEDEEDHEHVQIYLD